MELKEILAAARETMKGFCTICKECNGAGICNGSVPGMGGAGTGEGFKNQFRQLKKIKLIPRALHNVIKPVTEYKIFGETLSFPCMVAPMTGMKYNCGGHITDGEFCMDAVKGSVNVGTLAMIGDGADPQLYLDGLEAIKKVGGKGIAIIKPRTNEEIIKRIKLAEEAGCVAVGIDIDGAGLATMALYNQPVFPKTKEEIRELVASTKLPFIVKGIMSVEEAKICVEVGVAAIVVSNHGGRCLPDTVSAPEVLPEIVKAVKNKIIIMADGNVREGVDMFKYIALGADCVLVGRPILWGAFGGRQEGVEKILTTIKSQYSQAMLLTGCQTNEKITESCIVK